MLKNLVYECPPEKLSNNNSPYLNYSNNGSVIAIGSFCGGTESTFRASPSIIKIKKNGLPIGNCLHLQISSYDPYKFNLLNQVRIVV